jgi:hypothetical protein
MHSGIDELRTKSVPLKAVCASTDKSVSRLVKCIFSSPSTNREQLEMKNRRILQLALPPLGTSAERVAVQRTTWLYFLALIFLFVLTLIPSRSRTQTQQSTKPAGSEPIPRPAILAAFDKYEVVGMPEAHGMKDMAEPESPLTVQGSL